MSDPELGFFHHFEEPTAVPGQAGKPPVLLLLHGTGGDEEDLLPLARQIAPGVALLSPRGKVLEQGMLRFFRRLALNVFDEEDVRFRAAELVEFLKAARARYSLGERPIYALGYSNGANMAAALLLLHPEALAGAMLLRATMPIHPSQPPDLTGKPVFIAQGEVDMYVTPEDGRALEQALISAGAEVDLLRSAKGHPLEVIEFRSMALWAKNHFV